MKGEMKRDGEKESSRGVKNKEKERKKKKKE